MNSIPLNDAFPPWWDGAIESLSPPNPSSSADSCTKAAETKTILINDCLETDGKFLLYTLASQHLSHNNNQSTTNKSRRDDCGQRRLFWISGGSSTETQIAASLKKIGCSSSDLDNNMSSRVQIVSIAQHYSDLIMSDSKIKQESTDDEEEYLKSLYKRFREWSNAGDKDGPILLIIDNVTTMSNMFHNLHIFGFLQKVRKFLDSKSSSPGQSRCKHLIGIRSRMNIAHITDFLEDHNYIMSSSAAKRQKKRGNNINKTSANNSYHSSRNFDSWIGCGGSSNYLLELNASRSFFIHGGGSYRGKESPSCLLSNLLTEIAYGIVDVIPLSSGFSREAHGRLIFTKRLSGSPISMKIRHANNNSIEKTQQQQQDTNNVVVESSYLMLNYALSENGVKAIRLRCN